MRACPHCLTVYESDPEFCAFDGERTVPFADSRDPLVGLTLDDYRLEARLGVGGTGCVYRGRVLATGGYCAIKLLFGEMATDKSLALRFRREAEAMRRIDHPNVVSVIDCATSGAGLTYLVMEYVEGLTLKQVIEEEAPLAPGRVGRLAEQLVAGLAQAHRLGYVHRDLKPSNIMISGPPGSERAKILDFGIVASLHADEGDSRLTKTGYIVGTPTYMAPEQVDPKSVTAQADVYALGVILYEMLAGEPPFTGTLEQILVAKMTSPPPELRHTGELGPLVARLLATDPDERPASALHVSAELARLSLLSEDPATEKARVPELASLGVVGFGGSTVQLIDRTDPNPIPDPEVDPRDTDEGPWASETRLEPPPLDHDTPDSPYPDFSDEVPTTAAAPRSDTVVDARVLDHPSDTALQQAALEGLSSDVEIPGEMGSLLLDGSAPTSPELREEDPDDGPAELPTRVSSRHELEGFGRSSAPEPVTGDVPAAHFREGFDGDDTRDTGLTPDPIPFGAGARSPSAASAPHTPLGGGSGPTDLEGTPVDEEDSQATALAFDAPTGVDDTASLNTIDGPPDEEVGFADTRIRPAHLAGLEGATPEWGEVPATRVSAPPSYEDLVRPVHDLEASHARLASDRSSSGLLANPRAAEGPPPDDGLTALTLLPDDPVEDDSGTADTALDFNLERDVPNALTDSELLARARDRAPGFVEAPRPVSAPRAPGENRRWLLGVLFAMLLVLAAAMTYVVAVADQPVVIETPSAPTSTAVP